MVEPTLPLHIFTIGHSTHPIEKFIEILKQHKISAVADVRTHPFSKYNPAFNRDGLKEALQSKGISYVYLGHELGGRSEDPSCFEDGRVQYGKLAKTDQFIRGIERLLKGAGTHRIAIMCAEREPLACHRTLLVSRELEARGVLVSHIHSDGKLETHAEAMNRLIVILGLSGTNLFQSIEEVIKEAYLRQEDKIAFSKKDQRGQPEKEGQK